MFLQEVAAGTTLALSLVHTSKSAIEWFDQQHLSSGNMASVCVGLGGLLMARFMFSLDNSVDKKTGKRHWNTARGDLAEILGWCAGKSKSLENLFYSDRLFCQQQSDYFQNLRFTTFWRERFGEKTFQQLGILALGKHAPNSGDVCYPPPKHEGAKYFPAKNLPNYFSLQY